MPQPLQGITVLDFTRGMAGSVATMVMADFGAEVIKVEPPEGDPFRSLPASRMWHRGKKSVVLDLKSAEGRESLWRLAETADVAVESLRPGVVERLGIDYESLRQRRGDLVYCSITGWGPRGPYARYPGYEGMIEAGSGRMMFYAGQTRRTGPHYAVVNVASHSAAMAAVRGVVAALYVRDHTGQGQKVETSLLQAITYYDWVQWLFWQMMARDPEHYPSDNLVDFNRPPTLPYVPVRTRDGQWLQFANHMVRLFRAQLRALGLGHVLEDPRFSAAPKVGPQEQAELREMMLLRAQERTMDEWMELFLTVHTDVGAEPYYTTQESLRHPQMVHNGHVLEVADPVVGPMKQLGVLCRMAKTPGSIKGPAPELGQHTPILTFPRGGGKGPEWRGAVALRKTLDRIGSAALPARPLEGITVIDFTTVIAGPVAGSQLAEMGARVIRVETLEGDHIRGLQYGGVGANRTMAGTEGISLDLKAPEGRAIVHALVRRADVLMHNMRPGAPQRVGIDYETARGLNPTIVYIYIGGYGSTGPYARRPAMYAIGGCVSGGVRAQAGPGVPPPPEAPMTWEEVKEMSRMLSRAQEINPDHHTAAVSSTAIMLGLYARERFGIGQYLETTLIGSADYALADDFFDYADRPPRPMPDPEGYGLHALYRLYPTSEGWVFLACPQPKEWARLCAALGRPDLAEDPRFATPEARTANDAALAEALQAIFASKPAAHWETLLAGEGLGCVRAEERGMYHFFADDRHVREAGLTTEVECPRIGRVWRHGPGVTFSLTPSAVGPGILRGQHTVAILKELGYDHAEIEDLRARRVVGWDQ